MQLELLGQLQNVSEMTELMDRVSAQCGGEKGRVVVMGRVVEGYVESGGGYESGGGDKEGGGGDKEGGGGDEESDGDVVFFFVGIGVLVMMAYLFANQGR